MFLIRNRVIAAATRGTVVVEASARSGASQTLRRAMALGRRPMVVPGPVTSAMSVGCHELLRDYAEVRLVAGVAHVLEEIGQIGGDLAPRPRGPERPHDGLDAESAMVLESLPRRGFATPNDLAARAGLDIRTTLRRLSLLEGLGFLARRGGGYTLASRPGRAATPEPGATPSSSEASPPETASLQRATEAPAPTSEAQPHTSEAQTVASKAQASTPEAEPPVPEAEAAASEAFEASGAEIATPGGEASIPQAEAVALDAQPPTPEGRPPTPEASGAGLAPATSEAGAAKPVRAIAGGARRTGRSRVPKVVEAGASP